MAFISNTSDPVFDVAAALDAAVHGTTLKGFAGEYCAEVSHRKGSSAGTVHIPLAAALAVTKATGAGPLAGFGQAVPLVGFEMDSIVTDVAPAIRQELIAGRAGMRMVSTLESQFKLPLVNARPTAAVFDVDEVITNGGDSGFATVDIDPVVVATQTEVANSLSFARDPAATTIVMKHITEAILDAVDDAILNGYTTGSGRTWGGLAANSTASGVALNAASTIQNWRQVQDVLRTYMRMSDLSNMRWLGNPAVTSLLMASPVFAGATSAIAPSAKLDILAGADFVEAMLPAAATTEVYFGDFSAITAVAFQGASIELLANPYETTAFNRGSTLLRAIAGIGVGTSDANRIVSATVTL